MGGREAVVMDLDHASAREETVRHRGLLIRLKGIDGADKTTAVGQAVEALNGRTTLKLR